MSKLFFDVAHLLAGSLVLVSFLMLYQDRLTSLLNMYALHAGVAEHTQEQLDRCIRLHHLDPECRCVLAQEPGQVRRCRVRRVELGHRRRDEQDAHGARSVPHRGSSIT